MPKRNHVIGNPDELGVSPEVQDHLVQMARDYLAGRPAPEAPPATADIPLAEPARAEQQKPGAEHPRSVPRERQTKTTPRGAGVSAEA